jgi:hypothetical protein
VVVLLPVIVEILMLVVLLVHVVINQKISHAELSMLHNFVAVKYLQALLLVELVVMVVRVEDIFTQVMLLIFLDLQELKVSAQLVVRDL